MRKERHTRAETFIVPPGGNLNHEIVAALLRLEKAIPRGATMIPLPPDLKPHYKKEIHVHYDNGDIMPMEIAINKFWDGSRIVYEYSTDYEL